MDDANIYIYIYMDDANVRRLICVCAFYTFLYKHVYRLAEKRAYMDTLYVNACMCMSLLHTLKLFAIKLATQERQPSRFPV